jgi:hypothetical protein
MKMMMEVENRRECWAFVPAESPRRRHSIDDEPGGRSQRVDGREGHPPEGVLMKQEEDGDGDGDGGFDRD